MEKNVTIYTAGFCRLNGAKTISPDGRRTHHLGYGGWAALLDFGDHRRNYQGGEMATTKARMEVMAAAEALESLLGSHRVVLITDSHYLMTSAAENLPEWRAKGWLDENATFSTFRRTREERINRLTGLPYVNSKNEPRKFPVRTRVEQERIKNADQWLRISEELQRHAVEFRWAKLLPCLNTRAVAEMAEAATRSILAAA